MHGKIHEPGEGCPIPFRDVLRELLVTIDRSVIRIILTESDPDHRFSHRVIYIRPSTQSLTNGQVIDDE